MQTNCFTRNHEQSACVRIHIHFLYIPAVWLAIYNHGPRLWYAQTIKRHLFCTYLERNGYLTDTVTYTTCKNFMLHQDGIIYTCFAPTRSSLYFILEMQLWRALRKYVRHFLRIYTIISTKTEFFASPIYIIYCIINNSTLFVQNSLDQFIDFYLNTEYCEITSIQAANQENF